MAYVYHEKQESRLCGQHCLNNLLQGEMFDQTMMQRIANKIQAVEDKLLYDEKDERRSSASDAGDTEHQTRMGDFSIEVLLSALSRLNVSLLSGKHPDARECIENERFEAIVIQSRDHWFSLRKVHEKWLNVDSLLSRPIPLSTEKLMQWLLDVPNDVNIFLVLGQFPAPETPREGGSWVRMDDIEVKNDTWLPREEFSRARKVVMEKRLTGGTAEVCAPVNLRNVPPPSRPEIPRTPSLPSQPKVVHGERDQRSSVYTKNEVAVATSLTDHPDRACELLQLKPCDCATDAQTINQINRLVKDIYNAREYSTVAVSYFQITRIAAKSSRNRQNILYSSLRDALEWQTKEGIIKTNVRAEMRRFMKTLEDENPSYVRLRDAGISDLENRLALIMFATQLDDAYGVLKEPAMDTRSLLSLLHASQDQKAALRHLLLVARAVARGSFISANDLVEALRGQKQKLGIVGLSAASRLLEYLDCRENTSSLPSTKSLPTVKSAPQSNVSLHSEPVYLLSPSTPARERENNIVSLQKAQHSTSSSFEARLEPQDRIPRKSFTDLNDLRSVMQPNDSRERRTKAGEEGKLLSPEKPNRNEKAQTSSR